LQVYAERYYAKYLRMEIEKWQAPEMSYRVYATKKSDVYCLALLLWEMCTSKYFIKNFYYKNNFYKKTFREKMIFFLAEFALISKQRNKIINMIIIR